MTNINTITTLTIRQHGLVECGPCECRDHVSETTMSLKDFKSKYTVEDLDHNFDIICSEVVDTATGHVLSKREIQKLLRKDLGNTDMDIYYSREIDITLENHGNDVHAVMHWFDDDETYPYDEWSEEVMLQDVKMMSEKDIEEAIKEKLSETIDREFNVDKLFFRWRV